MQSKILLWCWLLSLISCFDPPKVKVKLEGRPMPSFDLLLQDSVTRLNTDSIREGNPVILFYFNPDCPYCKAQITDILNHISIFKGVQFYLFTSYQYKDLEDFYKRYHLKDYPNITVAVDYSNFFSTHFPVDAVPYLAIYDKEKKLKRILVGNHNVDSIRQIASE